MTKEKPLTAKDVLLEIKKIIFDQQKVFRKVTIITMIATVVIAFATLFNVAITQKMLSQMSVQTDQTERSIDLQDVYYQNTIRPFVYLKQVDNILSDDGKSVLLKYFVANSGSLPAKRTNYKMVLSNNAENNFNFNFNIETESGIFPNQTLSIPYRNGYVEVEEIRKNPFLKIHIIFSDANDKKYFYKAIWQTKNFDFSKKIRGRYSILWSSFN